MTDEVTADSGAESGIDMQAAQESISRELFRTEPTSEVAETPEPSETPEPETPESETPEPPEGEEPEPETPEIAAKAPPQSWKKDKHELWAQLSPDAQAYIEQREQEMRDGIDVAREDAHMGRTMRDLMAPYSELLKQQNIPEHDMIRNLMNAHYRMSVADPAGRLDLIKQLAGSYGLNLDGSEVPAPNPEVQALQSRLNQLEGHLTQRQQQERQQAQANVETEVSTFAESHEFFDEVAEQIVPLIQAGYSLEDAYQSALWMNPVTRQKEIDRQTAEAAKAADEKARQEIEKARKARSTNVQGRDTNAAPTEPVGTMEDTMRETYRAIHNRSH